MSAEIRRQPIQKRSLARRERILAATQQLLRRKGVEELKMSEVAEVAQIQIGSLYQYYSNKGALLTDLSQLYFNNAREQLEAALAKVQRREEVWTGLEKVFEQYVRQHRQDRAWAEVIRGISADRELQRLNFEDSLRNADLLYKHLVKKKWSKGSLKLRDFCRLALHLPSEVIQLSSYLGQKEGSRLESLYKDLFRRELRTLLLD